MDAVEHRAALPVRHWRMRRVLKWAGIAVCALLIAIAVFSFWFIVRYESSTWEVWITDGAFCVNWRVSPAFPGRGLIIRRRIYPIQEWVFFGLPQRWNIDAGRGTGRMLIVPLWVPVASFVIPTAWLWHLDRRRPAPGMCRCGYDLAGNTSGRCPECGKTANRSMEPNR